MASLESALALEMIQMVQLVAESAEVVHEHCPFVDLDDPGCASRLTMGRLEQAMTVCFGRYQACPMYHRLSGQVREEFVVCTIGVSLRPTGS